jgi:hypothetical protein
MVVAQAAAGQDESHPDLGRNIGFAFGLIILGQRGLSG